MAQVIVQNAAGEAIEVVDIDDPPYPKPAHVVAALDAVATARAEVAGYSPTNGTRQAVEALAVAVEALTAS